MNYRHAYHAGNHADVLKHLCLLALLDALASKPTPYFVLDTHAGEGCYALDSEAARKTGEAASGIGQLQHLHNTPAPLQRYLDAVRPYLAQGRYPGSPQLIADTLRENDRLACCELHPEAFARLKANVSGQRRIAAHLRDGYDAIKALLPPLEKRGLVIIDPPYEAQLAEFDTVLNALRTALARWPQGIYALWYPIKQRRSLYPFMRRVAALPAKNIWTAELTLRPDNSPLRLNGSGMLLLNPPWKLDQTLSSTLPLLAQTLGENNSGDWQLEWLRRE